MRHPGRAPKNWRGHFAADEGELRAVAYPHFRVSERSGKSHDEATIQSGREQCRFDPVDIGAAPESVTHAVQDEHRSPHDPLPSVLDIVRCEGEQRTNDTRTVTCPQHSGRYATLGNAELLAKPLPGRVRANYAQQSRTPRSCGHARASDAPQDCAGGVHCAERAPDPR